MKLNFNKNHIVIKILQDSTTNNKLINYLKDNIIHFKWRIDKKAVYIIINEKDYSFLKRYFEYYNIQYDIIYKEFNKDRFLRFLWIYIIFSIVIMLIYLSTNCVWQVKFEGNERITEEQLYSYLEYINLHPGIRKKLINCEELEEQFRIEFDEIAWISGRIEGGILTFGIKEGVENDTPEISNSKNRVFASNDGIVTKIVTRKGTPVVKEGDNVKKGDLLIDSKIVSTNEFGEEERVEEVDADGIVLAKCVYEYRDSLELHSKRISIGESINKGYRIEFPDKSFETSRIEIKDGEYIVNNRKQIELFKKIKVPIYITDIISVPYKYENIKYNNTVSKNILNDRLNKYLNELTQKGMQIIGKNVKIVKDGHTCYMQGEIIVNQSIVDDAHDSYSKE